MTISVTARVTRDIMTEDTESLRLEMLDEASLTRQPDEVSRALANQRPVCRSRVSRGQSIRLYSEHSISILPS